eukprot:141420_1
MAQANQYHFLDVNKHNTPEDAWLIIKNKVYDITDFKAHPGGHNVLLKNAGSDRTEQFLAVSHPNGAFETMKKFYVGDLIASIDDVQRQARLSNVVLAVFGSMTLYILKRSR